MGKAKRLREEWRKAPPPVGKQQRLQWSRWLPWLVGAFAIAAVTVAVAVRSGGHGASAAPTRPIDASLAGVTAGPAPWQPEYRHLAERLTPLGLHALGKEGTVLHIHAHLDVFVNGKRVSVPAAIGINDNSYITEVHTHDATGVIHIESPKNRIFALGTLFGEWGVRLTSRCIGGYCAHGNTRLHLFVNGDSSPVPPWRLPLHAHDEIVLAFGRPPKPIPTRYRFPAGQ